MTTPHLTDSQPRIFKIGPHRIVEETSTTHLNPEQIRALLKTQYPEVAHATVREYTTTDGQQIVEYLPQPGRKG